jgi:hypothetical protein
MSRARFVILAALAALSPLPAGAQTSDVLFGGWTWRAPETGSRPAGLGGAYVAVADGVRTATVNPAGLAFIPRLELSASTAPLWAGLARRIDHSLPVPPPVRPTEPGVPLPCPPGRRARPWALALYVEQSERQANPVEVVHGPSLSERGLLEGNTEEVGASLAKGLTPWLDVGVTLAWRHLTLDGSSVLLDGLGNEQRRITLGGDSNKARAIVGVLASFGPRHSPSDFRLGLAYERDLLSWSVERSEIDLARGQVTEPTQVKVQQPATLIAGFAWRISDKWLAAGQVGYTWFDGVTRELSRDASPFAIKDHVEPRAALELTQSSPIGGYYKIRAGVRREISGRAVYEGGDPVLRQAYRGLPAAVRASFGLSQLAEFYDHGVRLDLDVSQVVLERRLSLQAAGTRRFSIALTVRL